MLGKYDEKRDFSRTPEPRAQRKKGGGELTFVVQKHAARRLHFDFRLELDGVLKSWAVPLGPSPDPKTKRLAVMVEDHPLDYAAFEGTIPKGEYGAGEVIVWDRGSYVPQDEGRTLIESRSAAEKAVREGIAKGKISFVLNGHKLRGSWALVKMKRGENNWLLIKHSDEFASQADISSDNSSVLSSATIEKLRAGEIPVSGMDILDPSTLQGAGKASFPSTLQPMLAVLGSGLFSNQGWYFEPKLDGYRTIAFIDNKKVKLLSRRGLNVTANYPDIPVDLAELPLSQAVLDGEIVALDEQGKSCFQCLQQYPGTKSSEKAATIVYYVFDILYLNGYSLTGVPLDQRKLILKKILPVLSHVKSVAYFKGSGTKTYEASVEQGLEGVVAKKKDSRYEPGRRSPEWIKIKKTLSEEFVIGGFTTGSGNRSKYFGALLLGYYDETGKLIYAGNVGTGFNDSILAELRKKLDSIRIVKCPFSEKPALNVDIVWVKPDLVAEIKYAQWTKDNRLRAPVFMRLRNDKNASDISQAATVSTVVFNDPEKERSSDPGDVLQQLSGKNENITLEMDGHKLGLTNLNKIIWLADGNITAVTKRHFLQYLARVSHPMLNYLKGRPLTLIRFPGGITGEHFYQKHWDNTKPEFVNTAVLSEHNDGRREYLLCNNLMTLMWLGQIADVEFHTWLSRVSAPEVGHIKAKSKIQAEDSTAYPDFIVLDLDPYVYSGKEAPGDEPELNRRGFEKASELAVSLKEILDSLKLSAFIKTSGKTDLHIFVPVLKEFKFDAVRSAAETISRFLLERHPGDVTLDWQVGKRTGKIFIDYNQNVRGKSMAAPYSPRAVAGAPVSVPLEWSELGKIYPTDFNILNMPGRLADKGDLWNDLDSAKNDLRNVLNIKG